MFFVDHVDYDQITNKVHFDLESTLSASFLFLVTNTIIWVSLFDYKGISHELTAVGGKPYFSNQRHFSIAHYLNQD